MFENLALTALGASLPLTALIVKVVPKRQSVNPDTLELQVVVRELRQDIAEIKQELRYLRERG